MSESHPSNGVTKLALLCVCAIIVLFTAFAFVSSHHQGSKPFDVVLANDTSSTVHLQLCQFSDCGSHPDVRTLSPGMQMSTPAVTDSNLRPWIIRDLDDRQVGCLPLRFQDLPPLPQRTVRLSTAVPCGTDFGGHVVTGPNWPPLP